MSYFVLSSQSYFATSLYNTYSSVIIMKDAKFGKLSVRLLQQLRASRIHSFQNTFLNFYFTKDIQNQGDAC